MRLPAGARRVCSDCGCSSDKVPWPRERGQTVGARCSRCKNARWIDAVEARIGVRRSGTQHFARQTAILQLLEWYCRFGCTDCSNVLPVEVMQMDHLDSTEKSFPPARGDCTRSFVAIVLELSKCEPVCPTCHAFRTAISRERGEWTTGRRREHRNSEVA